MGLAVIKDCKRGFLPGILFRTCIGLAFSPFFLFLRQPLYQRQTFLLSRAADRSHAVSIIRAFLLLIIFEGMRLPVSVPVRMRLKPQLRLSVEALVAV